MQYLFSNIVYSASVTAVAIHKLYEKPLLAQGLALLR
jgi:hypothetical protein